jgi:carboxyl-terminal processing protease
MGFGIIQPMSYRQLNRLSCLLAAAAALLLSAPGGFAQALPDRCADMPPVELYHDVWQLIKDRYYDPGFNGQKWSRWEHKYDKYLKTTADAHKAIETMLASLGDRYTRYLNKEAFDDQTTVIEAKLYGIGIQMGVDKTHKLVVMTPIEGSPAEAAGLLPMDEIAEIDGKATSTMSVEQASKMIRGQIGTKVTLTIMRNKERKVFTITRDEIQVKSVQTAKMLSDDIGYIRLSTFMSQFANDEIRKALEKLSPARGIIIDLRSNPGGLVTNAIDICSMFMDGKGGIIVSTVDREGKFQSSRAPGTPISWQPLVLLINGASASAAEITSGALHDQKRAQLVGEKTFGKGLVQAITRLNDGSGVNITIARYVTPNNIDIHKKGIEPDFEVKLSNDDIRNGHGPWWIEPDGFTGKRQPEDLKDWQLKKAVDVLQEKMGLMSTAPKVELKLNPFPNADFSGIGIQ